MSFFSLVVCADAIFSTLTQMSWCHSPHSLMQPPARVSGQCEVYTQDRNQDNVKRTLRTGIRECERHNQDRESEQCERHTRNRYREFTRAKTKTQLGQCEVHSTGQEVYTQDRHQYSVKCTLRQCEVYTLDRNQDSVSVKCTPGQES